MTRYARTPGTEPMHEYRTPYLWVFRVYGESNGTSYTVTSEDSDKGGGLTAELTLGTFPTLNDALAAWGLVIVAQLKVEQEIYQ